MQADLGEHQTAIYWALIALAGKALFITCSGLFGYWGYRLFREGIYDKQGELKASYNGFKLGVRQFGPGMGFAALAITFSVMAAFRPVAARINDSEEGIPVKGTTLRDQTTERVQPAAIPCIGPPNTSTSTQSKTSQASTRQSSNKAGEGTKISTMQLSGSQRRDKPLGNDDLTMHRSKTDSNQASTTEPTEPNSSSEGNGSTVIFRSAPPPPNVRLPRLPGVGGINPTTQKKSSKMGLDMLHDPKSFPIYDPTKPMIDYVPIDPLHPNVNEPAPIYPDVPDGSAKPNR